MILESLLGLGRIGDVLHIAPCLPENWASFELQYRYRETLYNIAVRPLRQGETVTAAWVDGIQQAGSAILLQDDGKPHAVMITV